MVSFRSGARRGEMTRWGCSALVVRVGGPMCIILRARAVACAKFGEADLCLIWAGHSLWADLVIDEGFRILVGLGP